MGFSLKRIFRRGGSGGGGGSVHTPVEAKESGRSKQLVNITEILSEGEIEGLADGMKSVFFDNTPVQNKDGSFNFNNVQLDGCLGAQKQDTLNGFDTSQKEIPVKAQVRQQQPITRTITDNKVSRLRLTLGVQSLVKQEDNGDTNGTKVDLIVHLGTRSYPISIDGKYSSPYTRSYLFTDLPSVPFTVQVERVTADSTSQRLQNNTIWSSYTEIIDTEFTYPNTALMGVKFDSEYFGNIPTRTYDLLGLKVKVPSNYDTHTRQYTGMWDGTFKIDWTDNPAWVLYDIVTNKRYGLGGRLGEFGADKWALYQVAQYCDQLVPDGFGGQEPRFTCNAWLTEQRSAYQVINDICSIFRAMPVWNGQQLTVVMDRPADPVWTYTNANVDNGNFSYTFSAKKSRHNAIQVEYADKENSYEKAIEYVSDDESIRKNGLNVKKITAFGCTSRGQAHRTALWLLQTEKLETKTVTFTVGAEGLMHIPGDIIKVADTHYAGTNIGGRVLAVNGKTVTLDREITTSGNSYFSYINANAKHQNIKIISVSGAEVTLDQPPLGLELYSVWSLTTQQVTSQLFKALSVKEESKGKYTIMALQHEPQKEAIVDNGAKFEPVGTTLLTTPQISNVGITVNADGSVSIDTSVTGGNGIIKYDIRIYKGDALYDVRLGQKSPYFNIDGLENGNYRIVIQVKNENGQLLSEKTQTFTINKPPAPTGVRVTGGIGNITLEWDWVDDVTATEIFVSETDDIKTAKRLTKVTAKMYTHEVGAKKVRYYWLRHTRGVNIGPFYQLTGVRGESSVDIDAELEILNKKLSQNIVNEVFDTALPARNLDLIKTVNGLNTGSFIGHNQVYNTVDGKLYVWNGREYTTKVQASDLSGKLSKSQLDNALIGEINSAKTTADTAKSEIIDLSAKIQSEANARGNAISQLQNVDKQQAQQISALTAKAESALSGLEAEKTARANGDKAEAKARETLTSKVNNAESVINEIKSTKANKNEVASLAKSTLQAIWRNDAKAEVQSVSRTVADLSGKLSATHTIKTQAISGGKTAIAGISLGANEEESSVIVMADKFQVVPNAKGTPKPIFKVQNGKAVVAGDLIADGEITASKLATNSVTTGALQAGAVRAEHMAAGQITADKLAIGLGGNLLYNPIFANVQDNGLPHGCNWWGSETSSNIRAHSKQATDNWGLTHYLPNENQLLFSINGDTNAMGTVTMEVTSVIGGKWHILSAYMGVHRAESRLTARCFLKGGGYKDFHSDTFSGYSFNGGLGGYTKRAFVKFKAPDDAKSVQAIFWIISNSNENDKHLRVARPMLEECTEYTAQPSSWQNAGVTAIHGGSIVTNSITTQQMAANSITANEIATGAIAAKHIAAGSIGANHIATRSLTADKLNVSQLSAVSSNMGDINGGSLNINNRFKVSRDGQVEMRAATGKVGMVVNNDSIIVYDERGNVRVKIGKL